MGLTRIGIKREKKVSTSSRINGIRCVAEQPSVELTSVNIKSDHSAYSIRIAGYNRMTALEKKTLRDGSGFVRVPDEERERQRIESYSFLVR